jgi:GH25 family lysozyme M1 (1,4-beta-N-acetylmuramidase)
MFKGIDVSYVQGEIDWDKVKSQIDFAIIRAGYGQGNIDAYAKRNLAECNRLNIPCGVFWFSYALSIEMAKKEALFTLDLIKNYRLELPVYFDFEYDSVRYAKQMGVNPTKELINQINDAFCTLIQDNDYYAGIYTNSDYVRNTMSKDLLKKFDVWFAHYFVDKCDYPNCHLWQYADNLAIDGIKGNVDGNYAYIDFPAIIKQAGLNHLQELKTMTIAEAKEIVIEKTGFSDNTINYIADYYRYGDKVILTLAELLKEVQI